MSVCCVCKYGTMLGREAAEKERSNDDGRAIDRSTDWPTNRVPTEQPTDRLIQRPNGVNAREWYRWVGADPYGNITLISADNRHISSCCLYSFIHCSCRMVRWFLTTFSFIPVCFLMRSLTFLDDQLYLDSWMIDGSNGLFSFTSRWHLYLIFIQV